MWGIIGLFVVLGWETLLYHIMLQTYFSQRQFYQQSRFFKMYEMVVILNGPH